MNCLVDRTWNTLLGTNISSFWRQDTKYLNDYPQWFVVIFLDTNTIQRTHIPALRYFAVSSHLMFFPLGVFWWRKSSRKWQPSLLTYPLPKSLLEDAVSFFPKVQGGPPTIVINGVITPTPPKFNIAPKKWWLEDYFPIGKGTFQGPC